MGIKGLTQLVKKGAALLKYFGCAGLSSRLLFDDAENCSLEMNPS